MGGTGMNFDDEDEFGSGALGDPFRVSNLPSWSFNRVTDAHHDPSQMTELPGSLSDNGLDNNDDDDGDSTKAVVGGDISDSDTRMASLADSPPFQGPVHPGTPLEESTLTEFPQPDADDDELPVVELHVGEEDRL